ncbi:hemicentin-2-like [Xiphophorus hellerii]|uniref:hemicentin-2-like n=1 Tax=Xiphophorus hellerii TaxID=8084 RepID=UPI0013B4264C|nr:hemicentin-2-like [Xiphophorus hellerii]
MTEWILFVQLFVGLLLIPGEDASCPIELIPPRVVVKYGDPISVNCTTSAGKLDGLGWEASEGGASAANTQRYVMLTVQNVTQWGSHPMCFLNFEQSQCSTRLGLVIYTFPENISISSSIESSEEMTENVEYSFTCSILNIAPVQNLTVRWYKGNQVIYSENLTNSTKHPTNQTSIFRFTPTRQDDRTTIRCEAHMDLGPEGPQFNASSRELSIGVMFGPEIECHTVEIQEGESLDGKCKVTGNPTPQIKWLKNGHSINLQYSLRRNDTGTYEVKAEGLASVEKKVQLIVFYGPEWTCPHTYTILEHTRHNLTCSQGFPEPTEIWYKDEEEVQLPVFLTRSNAGQYFVRVSNNLTTLNFTVDIVVHYPPSHILELEDSEVEVGEVLGLKCSSVGNPRPNYSWIYYRTHNVNERTEDGISRLIINNATGFNIGSYTCHAWNERGNVSKTVRVTVKGAKQECPIEIHPDSMVLQYQSSGQSANCKAQTNNSDNNAYWLIRQKNGTNKKENISWTPNTHEDWDPSPVCHASFLGIGWCNKTLHYILYKQPENVSVSETVNNSASSEEGSSMTLECKIAKVAPAEHLRVRWLWQRGNETIEPDSVGIDSKSECSFPEDKSPVMVVCTMNITLNRTLHGIQVKCEAELNLGPKGPQPPPLMTSDPFTLSVLYKPTINTTKLPELVPVISGYKEELVCEADGNPAPKITWNYTSATAFLGSNGTLIVNEEGSYICIANNSLTTDTREVKVILKEDYLPLLAGFVALTVVAISIIFVFIYSIYYKNTKMRRYSLKNPKLSSHNGNVAHNGWDIQLPVTKLS